VRPTVGGGDGRRKKRGEVATDPMREWWVDAAAWTKRAIDQPKKVEFTSNKRARTGRWVKLQRCETEFPARAWLLPQCVPNNASRPWERCPDASPRSRAGLPCASAGAKRKARPVTLQIATALRGASPNVALHWAGTARITQKPASGLATKHTEMKGSVPSHLRCDARCIFFFLLQLRFLSRCQYTASQHYRADQGCPRFDAARDPTQGRAASHQPLTAPRTLKEPAIGCGCEISASSGPATRFNGQGVAQPSPKPWYPQARPGMHTNRVRSSAHIAPAEPGRWEAFDDTACTRFDLYALGASPALPSCPSLVQQLSVGSQAAPCAPVWNDARWPLSAATKLPRPEDGTRRAQGPKTYPMHLHVEIHPSR
jgi:hypothetical protein